MASRLVADSGEQGHEELEQAAKALLTLGAILATAAVIVTIVWWVVVLSPIGFGRAFEHTIGGDAMRIKVNSVFLVIIGLSLAGGAGSAGYGLWKYWRLP